jgi:hypothetical protein
VQTKNKFATVRVIKVLPDEDCASIGRDPMKCELDFKLFAACRASKLNPSSRKLMLSSRFTNESQRCNSFTAGKSFVLMFKTLSTAVFAADTALDSSSAGGRSARESFKMIFSKIDDITLDSLAEERFCSAECNIRQTNSSEKATEFNFRPETPEDPLPLWMIVTKFFWRWRRLNALVAGAVSSW